MKQFDQCKKILPLLLIALQVFNPEQVSSQEACLGHDSLVVNSDCYQITATYAFPPGVAPSPTKLQLYFDGKLLKEFTCSTPVCTDSTVLPPGTDPYVEHSWYYRVNPNSLSVVNSLMHYGNTGGIAKCFTHHYMPSGPNDFIPAGANIAYTFPKLLEKVRLSREEERPGYLPAIQRVNPITTQYEDLIPITNQYGKFCTPPADCRTELSFVAKLNVALGKFQGVTALFVSQADNYGFAGESSSESEIKIYGFYNGALLKTLKSPSIEKGQYLAVTSDSSTSLIVLGSPVGSPTNYVRIIDANSGAMLKTFRPYASTYRSGVRVATVDVNRDRIADMITAPGGGSIKTVNVVNGSNGAIIRSFAPFGDLPNIYGYNLSAVRDVDGVPVIAVSGPASTFSNGTPSGLAVRVYNATTAQLLYSISPSTGMPYIDNFASEGTVAFTKFSQNQRLLRDGLAVAVATDAFSYDSIGFYPPYVQLIDVLSKRIYSQHLLSPIPTYRPMWNNTSIAFVKTFFLPSITTAGMSNSDEAIVIR